MSLNKFNKGNFQAEYFQKSSGYLISYRELNFVGYEIESNKTNFEQIYLFSCNRYFAADIEELAKICGGRIIKRSAPNIYNGPFGTYLVVDTKEQFELAVDWLENRILIYDMIYQTEEW